MKIKKIETFSNQYLSFVKITTDRGDVGWGQMSTYHADITTQIFHRQVAPYSIGLKLQEQPNFADHLQLIIEKEHKFPGSYLLRAIAGLDTALWDLYGRLLEKPVASLIGGKPGKVRIYGSSMRRDISPQDESLRLCKLRDELGISAFKFRVGAECGRDKDEWEGRSEDIVKVLSHDLGADVQRLVDESKLCFDSIDVLVNNASTFYPTPIDEISEEHWDKLIGSNLKGPLFLIQGLKDKLIESRGTIVNITDTNLSKGVANFSIYASAKGGLESITKVLARELAPEVNVNAIAPGAMLEPPDVTWTEEQKEKVIANIPLKKMGSEKDIANTVHTQAVKDAWTAFKAEQAQQV